MNKNTGFSLIELLVVVAIISVLAAIAIPSYAQYRARTQVISGIAVLSSIMENIATTYAKSGAFPSSYTIGTTPFNTSLQSGIGYTTSWNAVTLPTTNIAYAYYMISLDGKGASVAISYSSLIGVNGFVAGANGNDTNGNLYYAVRDINGVMTTACGGNNSGGGDTNTIPSAYRPSNCQCTLIGAGLATGFTNTGTGC